MSTSHRYRVVFTNTPGEYTNKGTEIHMTVSAYTFADAEAEGREQVFARMRYPTAYAIQSITLMEDEEVLNGA